LPAPATWRSASSARFVELPGVDHLPFGGNHDAIVVELERFLDGR
jgi:hypothetical protein